MCRKEAKKSRYWIKLVDMQDNQKLGNGGKSLIKEATELMSIFGSI